METCSGVHDTLMSCTPQQKGAKPAWAKHLAHLACYTLSFNFLQMRVEPKSEPDVQHVDGCVAL